MKSWVASVFWLRGSVGSVLFLYFKRKGWTHLLSGLRRPPEGSRDCGSRPLVSVSTRKLFFGPFFEHFPGFLDIFLVIFRSKMVDFELGPECRPELFEAYLGVLPGSFLDPSWAPQGPSRAPGPGPWALPGVWGAEPPRFQGSLGGRSPPSVGP